MAKGRILLAILGLCAIVLLSFSLQANSVQAADKVLPGILLKPRSQLNKTLDEKRFKKNDF